MLQPHDLLPHFEMADLGGERVSYSSIWQRQHLVLVLLPHLDPPSRNYADRLMPKDRGLNDDDTEWIVTRDAVEGLQCPGVVVADRWGEIVHVVHSSHVEDLPPADELVEWVRYLQSRCPECDGGAK